MKNYNGIINISEPENDYCIYKMYSTNVSDNSIYIGVTKNYKERAYKHSITRKNKEYFNKPLYIWLNEIIDVQKINVIFEVIEKQLKREEAFEKEIIYIENFKKLNYNILNISEGGKGNKGNIPWNKGKKGIYTDDHIKKLSESHKGHIGGMKNKNHSNKTKNLISLRNKERKERGWLNPQNKKVYKYNSDNQFLIEYESLQEAGKIENVSPTSVGEWCRKTRKPKNGFIYSYIKLEY